MIGAGGGLVILTRTFRGVLIRIECKASRISKHAFAGFFGRRPQPQQNDTQNSRQKWRWDARTRSNYEVLIAALPMISAISILQNALHLSPGKMSAPRSAAGV
jgi:hypothetical protein